MSQEMRDVLRLKCIQSGDAKAHSLFEGVLATLSASWASLFFSSQPITLAFHTWEYKLVTFMSGAYMIYCCGQTLTKLESNNVFSAEHMRLTTSRFRGALHGNISAGVSSAGVQSLGVLYDGCPLEIKHDTLVKDSSHYVSFGRQITGNGFSFRTLAQPGTQQFDAVAFTVAVCDTNSLRALGSPLDCAEDDWKVVGSSRCIWTIYDPKCTNVKDAIYDTSLVRNFKHRISLTPSWFRMHCLVARALYVAIGCWGAVILALMGHQGAARRFWALVSLVLNGIVNGFGLAADMFWHQDPLSAVLPFGGGLFLGAFLGFFCCVC